MWQADDASCSLKKDFILYYFEHQKPGVQTVLMKNQVR